MSLVARLIPVLLAATALLGEWLPAAQVDCERWVAPVSYTHLDVYKRQSNRSRLKMYDFIVL